jgi:hypothetical protein
MQELLTASRATVQAEPSSGAAGDEDFRQRSGVNLVAGRAMKVAMILINETLVPEDERADLAKVNAELEVVAAQRIDNLDASDDPYRQSRIAWKIALFSNAMVHRYISLAEGVALSWNNANVLSAVLNARAMVETVAIYWEFGGQFSRFARALDFENVNRLAMNYLFSTRDEAILNDAPELKARQVLNAIDLIDKTIIPHFRGHYDRLSEFCHPNSSGHRVLFSQLDRRTMITAFGSRAAENFITPVKCALGTAVVFKHAKNSIDEDINDFARAHHAAHPPN